MVFSWIAFVERVHRYGLRQLLKINEPSFNVGVSQLDSHPLADVEAFKPAGQTAFNWNLQNAYPGAFCRRAGDDAVELLADARLQHDGGGGLGDLPFHLLG